MEQLILSQLERDIYRCTNQINDLRYKSIQLTVQSTITQIQLQEIKEKLNDVYNKN